MSLADIAEKIKKKKAPAKRKAISKEVRDARDFILKKFKLDKLEGSSRIREMGMARMLAEEISEIKFWEVFSMPYEVQSLTFLTSPKGQKEIRVQHRKFRYEPKSATKVEIDKNYHKHQSKLKPQVKLKSLDEFLKS